MAAVDNIDLTLTSEDDNKSAVASTAHPRYKDISSLSKSKSHIIDLTSHSSEEEGSGATPRSFASAVPISSGTEKQSPSFRSSSKKPRIISSEMNGKGSDHFSRVSSSPRKLEDAGAKPSSPSGKRQLGAASDTVPQRKQQSLEKNHRHKSQISLNGSRTSPMEVASSTNGDRPTINGAIVKSDAKLVNGHKTIERTSQSTSPAATPGAKSRIARKSSGSDRVFAVPATRNSSLNRSSVPRGHGSATDIPSDTQPHSDDAPKATGTQQPHSVVDTQPTHGLVSRDQEADVVESPSVLQQDPTQAQDDHPDAIMSDAQIVKESEQGVELPSESDTKPMHERRETPPVSKLSIPEFEQRLKYYLARLRSDHQYHVKSRLSRARKLAEVQFERRQFGKGAKPPALSSSKNPNSKGPIIHAKSPFSEMKSIEHNAQVTKSRVGKLAQYVAKTPNASKPVVSYSYVAYRQEQAAIPPYTTYISTKRNVLVEDDKHRTFLPYLGEAFNVDIADEDYAALETKIEGNQRNYHRMNRIMEKAALYAPIIDDFFKDIRSSSVAVLEFLLDESNRDRPAELSTEMGELWHKRIEYLEEEGYYEDQDDSDVTIRRRSNHVKKPEKQWRQLFERLPRESSGYELAAACLACHAFSSVAGFSLFHVVKQLQPERAASSSQPANLDEDTISVREDYTVPDLHSLGTYAELVCQVCKAHECPGHGQYEDSDDEKNIRTRVNLKPAISGSPNRRFGSTKPNKAFFDKEIGVKQLMGLEDDGKTVSGLFWSQLREGADSGFGDQEVCSEGCFWPKKDRADRLTVWTEDDLSNLKMLRSAFENDKRGACMISRARLISKPCKEIFLMLFETIPVSTRYSMKSYNAVKAAKTKMPPRRNHDHWLENPTTGNTYLQHKRDPFVPCNHTGPCDEQADCDCYNHGITCEKSCACSETCSRRFQGCRCAQKGKSCRFNDRCDCWRLNRECDPDLCRSCGAHEVLDPANRRNEAAVQGRCTNVYIQRGVPKRTLLGPSKLMAACNKSGWGLYMGEECKKWDYIGEYRGEIISDVEADLRGTIYDKRNMSYLFTLNHEQTLDSTLMGNKLRFINHQADPFANCLAKLMLCNSVQRIGMFALKDIEIGEEMYFNYGPGFATKFDLIKMNHDGPPTIEHPPKIPISGGKSPHFKRSIDTSSSSTIGVHRYRQMKNTLSKNGLRIGRPPKYPILEDQSSSTAMLNSEDPIPGPRSRFNKRRSKKRRRSEAILDEDPDDEEYVDPYIARQSRYGYHAHESDGDAMSIAEESENPDQDMRDLRSMLSSEGVKHGQVNLESEEESRPGPSKVDTADDDDLQESSSLAEESQEEMRIEPVRRPRRQRKPRKDKGIPRVVKSARGGVKGGVRGKGKGKAGDPTTTATGRKRRTKNRVAIEEDDETPQLPMKRKSKPSLKLTSNQGAAASAAPPALPNPRRLKLLGPKKGGSRKGIGRGTKESPIGLDGQADEVVPQSESEVEEEEEEEEEEENENENSEVEESEAEEEEEEGEEEGEEEEEVPEKKETPQQRGWRTRYANMERAKKEVGKAVRRTEKNLKKWPRKRAAPFSPREDGL